MNLYITNLVNTGPMTKVSSGIQVLLFIKEFMLEEKLPNVENLSSTQTLLNRQQFSAERKPINVVSVGKLSGTAQSLLDTRKSTLERDPMSVTSVEKALGGDQISLDTRESTLGRDLLNAKNVEEPSA